MKVHYELIHKIVTILGFQIDPEPKAHLVRVCAFPRSVVQMDALSVLWPEAFRNPYVAHQGGSLLTSVKRCIYRVS